MKLLDGVRADATISSCGTYRYRLTRDWAETGRGHALWVMLNPSTADADSDDQTLRTCQGFAQRWGYDGITVANLFALRSTDPKALYNHPDPVGPGNDETLGLLFDDPKISLVMVAWGEHGAYLNRGLLVGRLAESARRTLHVLGLTKAGRPVHPLARGKSRIPADTEPQVWVA